MAGLVPDVTVLSGSAATRESVLAALPPHRIAHFACHAVSDPRSPALNRLLHDHLSAPLTAVELTALETTVDLAYLSACETARSSEALADEAVHLATVFQSAGCRHVIATLWPVDDAAAGRIATEFYTALAPSFDTGDTARALHRRSAPCAGTPWTGRPGGRRTFISNPPEAFTCVNAQGPEMGALPRE